MIFLAAALILVPARLPPIDQCASDQSFVRYRAELVHAVRRRDGKALLGLLSDDIMLDFDGRTGRRDFARKWGLNRRRQSPVWRDLGTLLGLGCARVGEVRVMPSLVEQLTGDDQFDKLIAVVPKAPLRAVPRDNGRILARLDFHVLSWVGDSPSADYVRVRRSDGLVGYARRDQLRSALEYRAQFEKVRGRWRMTSFVEGD